MRPARALLARRWGPASEVLQLETIPEPEADAGQVFIDVRAIGCNFYDTLIVQGRYQLRPEFPFAPGGEVAGVVRAVGAGVVGLSPGDRVLALLPYGGYASVVVVPSKLVFQLPDVMSFEHAAAFPIAYQTAYFALRFRGHLGLGETLLVHAAAGGVGLAAVEVGRALGARVLATAGSAAKCALAKQHGAHEAYDYRQEEWRQRVLDATDGKGADVIFDPVGGDVFDASTRCVAFGGRLLVIGFASGRIPSVACNRIMLKNIAVVGLNWPAYRDQAPDRLGEAMDGLFRLYEAGELRPLVHMSRPLEEAAAALDELAKRRTVGKVVLIP